MLPSKHGTFVYIRCPVKFPEKLKNATWQKKKSIADKAFKGGTGLGEALTSAATAFDVIKFELLEYSSTRMTPPTTESYVAHKKAAASQLSLVGAVQNKVNAAKALAKTTSVDKNLSKDARKAAGEIEIGLGDVAGWLDAIDLTDFDAAIKIMEAKVKTAATAEEEKFTKLRDDYKLLSKAFNDSLFSLRKSPNLEELIKQNVANKAFLLNEAAQTLVKIGGSKYAAFASDAKKKYDIATDANHTIRQNYDDRHREENRDVIKKKINEFVDKFI